MAVWAAGNGGIILLCDLETLPAKKLIDISLDTQSIIHLSSKCLDYPCVETQNSNQVICQSLLNKVARDHWERSNKLPGFYSHYPFGINLISQ